MDRLGLFVASLLDASSRAYASGAVTRLVESGAGAGHGFRGLVADVQGRIESLASSLAVGLPALLAHEASWAAAAWSARGADLDLLRAEYEFLRAELVERLPSETTPLVREHLAAAARAVAAPEVPEATILVDGLPMVEAARGFLVAVLEGRRDDAIRIVLDAVESGASALDVQRHVLGRVQAEMGRMWQIGEVNVAEEHLGTRVVEEALVHLRTYLPREPWNGRTVLVAAVSGNAHQLGARVVADRFESAGWRALFLGADTPNDDLVAAVGHFGAHLVALSAGMAVDTRAVADFADALHREHARVPLLVGSRLLGRRRPVARGRGRRLRAERGRGDRCSGAGAPKLSPFGSWGACVFLSRRGAAQRPRGET
ncbi:MAG: cobalamin-dependent protein [Planctomycetota bacterium]